MHGTMLVASAALVLSGSQDLGASQPQTATDPLSASAGYTVLREEFKFTRPTTISEVAPAGIVMGPLSIANDAGTIQDVILELSISHPCSGDIDAWLYYDVDDDGTYDAETPIEFYLARSEISVSPDWSCSVELNGTYYFKHEQDAEALTDWDTGEFTSFRGLRGGGSFYLRVVDAVEGEVGTIESWTVHISSDQVVETAFTASPDPARPSR